MPPRQRRPPRRIGTPPTRPMARPMPTWARTKPPAAIAQSTRPPSASARPEWRGPPGRLYWSARGSRASATRGPSSDWSQGLTRRASARRFGRCALPSFALFRSLSMRLASDSRPWHCSALHCSAHSALLCIALSTLLCTAFSLLYTAPLLCRFSSPCKPRACAGFTRLCTAAAASLPTSHRLAQDHQTAESMHRITRLNHSPHPAPALCSAQRAGARPRRSVHTLFRACSVRLGRAPWFASII